MSFELYLIKYEDKNGRLYEENSMTIETVVITENIKELLLESEKYLKKQAVWESDFDNFDVYIINNDFLWDLISKLKSEWFKNAKDSTNNEIINEITDEYIHECTAIGNTINLLTLKLNNFLDQTNYLIKLG